MSTDAESQVVNDFMANWGWGEDHYRELAKAVENVCDTALQAKNVPCIVKSRAKARESLQEKLNSRNQDRIGYGRPYQKREDILDDIKDLAGVRIALYFPQQKAEIKDIIKDNFKLEGETKEFRSELGRTRDHPEPDDYRWNFLRYEAVHYYVRLKENDSKNKKFLNETVELQVTSLLRHAWSEVEHDIIYKVKERLAASVDQLRIIDGLGGAIYMGECFLDQLYDARKLDAASAEKEFKSIYDIGVLISDSMFKVAKRTEPNKEKDENLGPILALKRLLEVLGMNKRVYLDNMVKDLYEDIDKNALYNNIKRSYEPIELTASVYIIDHILRNNEKEVQTVTQQAKTHNASNIHLHRLKVMASTMIWIDEFFVPLSSWYEQLVDYKITQSEKHKRSLLWLDSAKVTMTLQKGGQLDLEAQKMVDELWEWFKGHPKSTVQFAFKISKLGVLRSFPQETHLLGRVYVLLRRRLKLNS